MKVTTEMGLTYQVDMVEVMPWTNTAIAASDMRAIPSALTMAEVTPTLLRMGPLRQKRSSRPMMRRLKRLLPKASPAARSGSPNSAIAPTPGLSDAGRSGLARLPRGFAEITARRNANATRLGEVLARDKGWRPLVAANDVNVPYRLVMRCDDEATAAQRFDAYRRRGCPVESWPDLAPEVAAEPDRHAAAIRLRQTLLLFPVHQSIEIDELIHRCRF